MQSQLQQHKPSRAHARKSIVVFCLILAAGLLFASPRLWSETPACDLTGTWYGGGDVVKYLMTVTLRPGWTESYTLVFNGSANLAVIGFPVGTPATGSIIRRYRRNVPPYELSAIALANTSDSFPPPAPQVWAVHAVGQLIDCNTIKFDYDFFGAYLWPTDKVPFTSPPDYVVVPPPFAETYHRMPTRCAQCGTP